MRINLRRKEFVMRGTVFILACLQCFLLRPSYAALRDQVYETLLPNGLKVILLETRRAPVITFQVWYRVGSRNEEWGKTGLSHMLEHMMFKGTENISGKDFSRIIQENGGNDNAFTSQDFTAYFENLCADRIQVSLDLESDRMQHLLLKEDDFETERMVVLEERRLRTEDNPKAYLLEQLNATAFNASPYHWPTVGWMQDIERFSLEDLKVYYRTFYNPANAFLVVAGDFKKEDLLPRIAKAFGPLQKGIAPGQQKDIDEPQTGERRIIVRKEAKLPFLVMAFHVPNLRDPDSYVLEVIGSLLSSGKSSRLYKKLVQESQLAIDVDAENSLVSRDPNLFMISAAVFPGSNVAELETTLDEELEKLRTIEVGELELQKGKNQIEAAFVFARDSLFYRAMLLAQYEIGLDWKRIDDYIPSVRKVTSEDILRVARRYLIPDNRTVGVLLPLPPGQEKAAPSTFTIRSRVVR